MVALPSCECWSLASIVTMYMKLAPLDPFSMPAWTHTMHYTRDLLSLWTQFAWLRLVCATEEVLELAYCWTIPDSPLAGKPSEVHRRCLEEVQTISSATLFAPVMRTEAVQSMSASQRLVFKTCLSYQIDHFPSPCFGLVRQRMVKWWARC